VNSETKTTKLEGIGRRASYRQDTVFNNLWHVLDCDLLRDSYERLRGNKAAGSDGVTKAQYSVNVEEKLSALHGRLRRNAYKPKASRIVEIPKDDGSTRPLAISCFEDKIVQLSVSRILTKLYEPLFLPCSYGFRETRKAHDALRALMNYSRRYPEGTLVDIDLRKYFNSIPHEKMLEILRGKISDKRFLRLVHKLMRSPIWVNGIPELNKVGVPQGSIVSPILSNIYLHYVIDEWFSTVRAHHLKGSGEMVRFADDMVFIFQHPSDAQRFYAALPKRLSKYGLEIHEDKSSVLQSGARHAAHAERMNTRLPTYRFLGFTCYWGKSQRGAWRLKYKSRADRLRQTLKATRKVLWENLHIKTHVGIEKVKRVVIGWSNYHAISDNHKQVSSFIHLSKRILFEWINRKGGKRKTSWVSFNGLLERVNYPTYFKVTSMFRAC
jgi:RNA-directed DNA polymerase